MSIVIEQNEIDLLTQLLNQASNYHPPITQEEVEFIIQLSREGFVLNADSNLGLEFDWYPDYDDGLFNDGGANECIEIIRMGSPVASWHAWAKSERNGGSRSIALERNEDTNLDIASLIDDSQCGHTITQNLREALYTCSACGNTQDYREAWSEQFSGLGFAGHICKDCDADGNIRDRVEWYDSRTGRSWNA